MPLPTRPQDSAPATGDITTDSQPQLPLPIGMLDREGITKFINDMGLLTYLVRSVRISNYLDSLLRLASLLTQTNIFAQANDVVEADVVRMIREHVEYLHSSGKYDDFFYLCHRLRGVAFAAFLLIITIRLTDKYNNEK